MEFANRDKYCIQDLIRIVKHLRSPEGCPWDRAQTHSSIRTNLIEEAYEAVEAIDISDSDLLREELGDVLLQIVFHCSIEEEEDNFSFEDVIDGVCRKLISRHPHVFAGETSNTKQEAHETFIKTKLRLRRETPEESVKNVSKILPALMRTQKVQSRAARAGYGVFSTEDAIEETADRLQYLETLIENGKQDDYSQEIGDLLFSVTEIARLIDIDSETALYDSCQRFTDKFFHNILLEKR